MKKISLIALNSQFRDGLISLLTGTVLALMFLFTFTTVTTKPVMASEEGAWTCAEPPPNCGFLACYHDLTGGHQCKYMALQNGANCSSSAQCDYKPWAD